MNRSVTVKLIMILAIISILLTQNLLAAGTPAGTIISNTATLSYKDLAGNSLPVVTAIVTITVAQKAGVALTPGTSTQIVGDSVWAYYPFVVTNTGNGKDVYDLSSLSSNSWLREIYFDANNNGILDPSELGAGIVALTDSILADSSESFIARTFVPQGTANGFIDTLTVQAASKFNSPVTASGRYQTTVQRAILGVAKSQDISNPVPDQAITYTLAYTNSGSGTAANVTISDVININLTLVNGSITGGGAYNSGNRTITWALPRIGAGESGSVSFQARVKNPAVMGTSITNQASYAYTDSTNGKPKDSTSNITTATVGLLTALASTITPPSQTQDIGLPVQYHLTVTNNGTAIDSISLAFSSTQSFTWIYYIDVNGNGVIDGIDSIINSKKLGPLSPAGGSLSLIAIDTIASSLVDQTLDSTRYTFTSLTNSATSTFVDGMTTIRAPHITLSKNVSVVGGGSPVPGASLLYTITYGNSGSGVSEQTVITDTIPANTDYTLQTVYLNGVLKTDGVDGDEVSFASNIITVNLGTLSATSSGSITFEVKIK